MKKFLFLIIIISSFLLLGQKVDAACDPTLNLEVSLLKNSATGQNDKVNLKAIFSSVNPECRSLIERAEVKGITLGVTKQDGQEVKAGSGVYTTRLSQSSVQTNYNYTFQELRSFGFKDGDNVPFFAKFEEGSRKYEHRQGITLELGVVVAPPSTTPLPPFQPASTPPVSGQPISGQPTGPVTPGQPVGPGPGQPVGGEFPNPIGSGTFEELVAKIAAQVFRLAIPLAVIVIIIIGLQFMMSGGNEEKLAQAKRNFMWAVVGLAIILLSNALISIIRSVL